MSFCPKSKGLDHTQLKEDFCRHCGEDAGPTLRAKQHSQGFSPAKIEQLSRVAPVLDLTESDELDSNQQVLQSFKPQAALALPTAMARPLPKYSTYALNTAIVEKSRRRTSGQKAQLKVEADVNSILTSNSKLTPRIRGSRSTGTLKSVTVTLELRTVRVYVGYKGEEWPWSEYLQIGLYLNTYYQ